MISSSRSLHIRTIAIYTEPDAASNHVSQADLAVLLPGSPANAYLKGYAWARIMFSHILLLRLFAVLRLLCSNGSGASLLSCISNLFCFLSLAFQFTSFSLPTPELSLLSFHQRRDNQNSQGEQSGCHYTWLWLLIRECRLRQGGRRLWYGLGWTEPGEY